MNLYQKLKDDLTNYRKARDSERSKLLQTLVGELNTKEKSNVVIDDAYIYKLIKIFVNNNNLTIDKLSVVETINRLRDENVFLESYLPKMLSEDEIKTIISEHALTDVPSGMKYFKEYHNGQYDGKLVSSLLKG